MPARILLSLLILTSWLAVSCKKEGGNSPAPVAPDTLTTGWSKTKVSPNGIVDIVFKDADTGYCINNTLYKSVNGGVSWDSVYQVPAGIGVSNCALTPQGKLLLTGGKLLTSANGGQSFTSTSFDLRPWDVCFTSETDGFVTGIFNSPSSSFRYTRDGGNTWNTSVNLPVSLFYNTVLARSPDKVWVVHILGAFVVNTLTNTFIKAPLALDTSNYQHVAAISLPDDNTVYISTGAGYLFKSTNGGNSFSTARQLPAGLGFYDVHFLTSTLGYASYGRHIYKTTDGGITWQTVVSLANANVEEIYFTDDAHGWACTNSGDVLRFKG